MTRALVALAALAALATTGCPQRTDPPKRVEIYAFTAGPPSRAATLTSSDTVHQVRVAVGVALAVTSWTTCPLNPPTTLTSSDPSVLGARKVYRNGMDNQFVIFGQLAGTTTLMVTNGCAEQKYEVTVTSE